MRGGVCRPTLPKRSRRPGARRPRSRRLVGAEWARHHRARRARGTCAAGLVHPARRAGLRRRPPRLSAPREQSAIAARISRFLREKIDSARQTDRTIFVKSKVYVKSSDYQTGNSTRVEPGKKTANRE